MSCRKLYFIILVTLTIIAALGAWAMIDGAIAYQNRPVLFDFAEPGNFVSHAEYNTMEG